VYFVFGKRSIDLDKLTEWLTTSNVLPINYSKPVVILYDLEYHHCMEVVQQCIQSTRPDLTVYTSTISTSSESRGRILHLNQPVDACDVLYIGAQGPALVHWMLKHNTCQYYLYNPITQTGQLQDTSVNKLLKRRYFMVQQAKDALVIGIVVATLGVANYLSIIEHVKQLITTHHRKHYLFIVGKLNVAKMANFDGVDVFVLISCPETILLNSKDYYKPIVTPFELELALDPRQEWTGEYVTEFDQLLTRSIQEEVQESEEAHFSLVTGKLKHIHISTHDTVSAALSTTHPSRQVALSSAEYLHERDFKGLDPRIGQDAPSTLQQGRRGIARTYTHEDASNISG
jgi:diphthamide biosynthesis protein 2